MKLSIFSLPKDCSSYEELSSFLFSNGISGVEPYPGWNFAEPDIELANKLRKHCEKLGVAIPCFSAFSDLGVPGREEEVERIKKYIDVAAALGSPYFHSTLVPFIDKAAVPPMENVYDTTVERVKVICDYAQKRNVKCIYEPQGMIFNGLENMKKLFKGVDGAAELLLDVGNVYFVDEEPYDMARELAPIIKHVHFKDYQRRSSLEECEGVRAYETKNGNYLYDVKLGTGVIDFARIFNILLDAGYDGWYSLEYGSTLESVREGAITLEKIYNDVLNTRK